MKIKQIVTPFFIVLFLITSISGKIQAQIYAPEGLNMPGDWDSWTNPPANKAFAGEAQTTGGRVVLIPLGQPVYQTIFHVAASGGDVQAGSYQFKFTSGALNNIWQNQWGAVDFTMNTIEEVQYGTAGSNEPQPNTITLADDKWYVVNWNNTGYSNTDALFMELSAHPVNIVTVDQTPAIPRKNDTVFVTIQTSDIPAPEEKIYLRYSTDGWVSYHLQPFSFNKQEGTAEIPPFPVNTSVNYYVFSTVFNNPAEPIDLITIHYNNNGGTNYEYTVADTLSCGSSVTLISTDPPFPLDTSAVIVTFNAALGNGGLAGYNDTVYAHTGVITTESVDSHDWKHVKTQWGENTPETRMTLIDSNLYQLAIPNIRDYYQLDTGEKVLKMAFVFRSKEPVNGHYLEGKTAVPDDIFTTVYKDELNVKITYPAGREPLVDPQQLMPVCVASLHSDSLSLFLDDSLLTATSETALFHTLDPSGITPGIHWLIAAAYDINSEATDSVRIYVRGPVPVAALPNGVQSGINYLNDSTVTLVLHDPPALKKYAFVIGDMNDWVPTDKGYMNRTPQGDYYWITLTGLTPGEEYAYQYYIDGALKLADPYCDKILDPYNDKWIPEENYPDLKPYPFDKTTGNVSVLQTEQTPYNWQVPHFVPEAVNAHQSDLVIYELLIRDFVADRRIASVMDTLDYLKTLGVNAIELMPINEFEGNDSWGYNPDFYFAPDKAYGTKNDYKAFIDACHQKGIAVIMDIALNHSFGQAPMVQMYWNKALNRPSAQNPWYNQVAPHPLSPGYDFNHESPYTKAFCKRIFAYWMTEYKIDGFRLDLSKGFTQKHSDNIAEWGHYDPSRINILTDYYHFMKTVNPNAYDILEHFSDNDEEVVLANTGMLPWGKMTNNFNQATMGYVTNSDFSWAYYTDRGYTYPNLIPFMESHDEERLMYKNMMYGNAAGSYNIKDTLTALQRIEAVAPLYFAVPGPKMLWQFEELGYDYSINACPGDTVNEACRTWSKPVRWDYWQQPERQRLYRVFSALAKLKQEQPAFEEGTFTKDLSGLGKRAWISHSSLNVSTGANFDVTAMNLHPAFQHTGIWYNYFTGEEVQVDNANGYTLSLEPGGYYLFTDKKLDRPFVNLAFEVVNYETGQPVPNVNITVENQGTHQTGADGTTYFSPLSDNDYAYAVHAGGYLDASETVTVTQKDTLIHIALKTDGMVETAADNLKVYPNPASGFVQVVTKAQGKLLLSDLNGRILLVQQLNAGKTKLDINGLTKGVYLLQWNTAKETTTRKIVINY